MAQQVVGVVLRNTAFGFGAQLGIKLLSFGFSILVVRHLGAADYGQYAAVLAFGALFVFLADLGLSPYAVREVARLRDAADGPARIAALFGDLLALRLLLSALAAALLILTAVLTGRPAAMVGAIALGTLGLIMYGVQGSAESLLAGHERLDLSAVTKVVQQLAFVLVGAAALWFGFGYYGLIVANLLGIGLMTGLCWRAVRGLSLRPGRPSPDLWPGLLRASIPFGLIGFTLGLSYRFDSVLLNIFRGDAETGYYNAAYNLVFSAAVVSNVINTSLYPTLTRQAVSAADGLAEVYARSLRLLLLLGLPIAVGGSVLADRLVPFLFTEAYLPAVPALQIVVWATPLMFVSEFLGYVSLIRGAEGRVARAVAISTGCNVLANLALVPSFGLVGAALMTVVTEAILVGQYVWLLRDLFARWDLGQALGRPLLAAGLMGTAVLLLRDLPLPVTVACGGLLYGGLLLLLRALRPDELRFILSRGRSAAAASPTV